MPANKSIMTKGMRSSEFWITAIFPYAMMIANHLFGWGMTNEELGIGAIGPGAYAISRGMAK